MSDDQILWIDNKAYRKGYTTGTCATAASKAAALMASKQQLVEQVRVVTPSGVTLDLEVLEAEYSPSRGIAAIRKDGGDDVDVTHGMLIFSCVTLNNTGMITIEGGEGIGRVTRQGIRHKLGDAAINERPRQTISEEVRKVIGDDQGAEVLIYAPEGMARAQDTYNPRLGIVGGISILGTTGIVTPMSDESWKQSISLEMEMRHSEGWHTLIFVPGNYGEGFAKSLGFNGTNVVVISNFIRHALKEAERLKFNKVLLLGHFGKLVKVAAGVFNTHSHVADARMETLVTHLALMGVPPPVLLQIYHCQTTEEAMILIDDMGYQAVYQVIALKIKERMALLSKFTKTPLQTEAVLCSMTGQVLASSCPVDSLLKEFAS